MDVERQSGTGAPGTRFSGIHLRLPGYGDNGPTLEIYQYSENAPKPPPIANREGFAHVAFEVEDAAAAMAQVLVHGGSKIGEVTHSLVEAVGTLTFVYLADPEGNIIELQAWTRMSEPDRGEARYNRNGSLFYVSTGVDTPRQPRIHSYLKEREPVSAVPIRNRGAS